MLNALTQGWRVSRAVAALPLTRWSFARAPQNQFTRMGFDTIPNFLPKSECDRLIGLADDWIRDGSRHLNESAYVVERARKARQTDTQVVQVMNAQTMDAGLASLFGSGRLEAIFEERLGFSMKLESLTLQVDRPDTLTKRGYHIDSLVRPNYKAFVYLSDVHALEDGPYTIIPGSHRHMTRKAVNIFHNAFKKQPLTEMELFYRDANAHSFLGNAGDLIVSCQNCAHKGWSHHTGKTRYVLIAYMRPTHQVGDSEFKLGKGLVQDDRTMS